MCLIIKKKKKKKKKTLYLSAHDASVCCLQKTEIPIGFPENILNCANYNVELELNAVKKRVGIYIHKDISYIRRTDLEENDLHIVSL